MTLSDPKIWGIIFALGLGTFLIRFSFLGLVGDRPLPEWLIRCLRYTPMAVLPGLVAPLVIWPDATGGEPDLPRIFAALATILVGLVKRDTLWAIGAGLVTLYASLALLG
ncbi:MAG: AzlD domain-containing protein [Mangrovicoccus sp.]